MSKSFSKRLFPHLQLLAHDFGTPFHIYDERGIRETGARLKKAFEGVEGFQEYYAVKALPNPRILKIMHEMGFGFDCSSIIELELAREAGAKPEDIMFTSNNTTTAEFNKARAEEAIINLDDISLIDKLKYADNMVEFPDLICFRLNPGKARKGNSIIGKPEKAKYGITYKQLIPAYQAAINKGAERFGLHTMVCSNQLDYTYMVDTARMLLDAVETVSGALDIKFEFINIGGGVGIPYDPAEHKPFDLEKMAKLIRGLLEKFNKDHGWVPKLFMESGRFMTGPHGVLVTRAINRKEIYQTHVGVDSGMPALMRHAIYGAYHHVTVLDHSGEPVTVNKKRPLEKVNIVGAICENCDRLATDRVLPRIESDEVTGDLLVVHDTGAHGIAMGFNYNGRTRPQELLLRMDGQIELIRRAETTLDLRATLKFMPKIVKP